MLFSKFQLGNAKNGGAERRRFFAIWEKPEGVFGDEMSSSHPGSFRLQQTLENFYRRNFVAWVIKFHFGQQIY